MKRFLALIISLTMLLATALPVAASDTAPLVERVFSLDMKSGVSYYKGEKYIYLDVSVSDIADPYGLLSVEFIVEFDGEALSPLWQTDRELNKDQPPMVVAWPTYEKVILLPDDTLYTEECFAVEALCPSYATTGPGKLEINLVVDIDYINEGVTEDGGMAVRLYFIPVNGFNEGDAYTFTINGQYDVPYGNRADITLAGSSGLLLEEGSDRTKIRVFGRGGECSCKVTAFTSGDLKGDVNFDGTADSADAGLALRYDAGLAELGTDGIFTADVDGNGMADSADAALILKYDLGLIDKF